MNSPTNSSDVKAIFVATARRLTAPPDLKALPEHASAVDQPDTIPDMALNLPPLPHRPVDRHIHSLGYGIDE